ncbi:hypothetical protein E2C01_030265 [Portunus trituberculatus]|uniref:Uncharacterized protein n=1 Tax=Portunus trituberculatus TaxID=210409 RepID=A0A5B7EU96_PORTR|nr:hypothetical protein [Portunus trituberculatus]
MAGEGRGGNVNSGTQPVKGEVSAWLERETRPAQPNHILPVPFSTLPLVHSTATSVIGSCFNGTAIQEIIVSHILLKDIEAHGPVLKSVVRQYERIAAAAASPPTSSPSPTPASGDRAGAAPQDPLTAPGRLQHPRRGTKDNIPRKARSLEKRWHQIYLRSLEWHYYLEGVIANFKTCGVYSRKNNSTRVFVLSDVVVPQ